jgi:hypothetical protein
LQIACADCRTGHFTVKKRDQGKTLGCSSQKSIYNGITKSYTYSGCTTRVGVPVAETLWDIEEHGFDTKDATPELVCDMLNMIPVSVCAHGFGIKLLTQVSNGRSLEHAIVSSKWAIRTFGRTAKDLGNEYYGNCLTVFHYKDITFIAAFHGRSSTVPGFEASLGPRPMMFKP